MCNITKCCQEVCPEHIKITDNAIIPLKERTATDFYDPIGQLVRRLKPAREPQGKTQAVASLDGSPDGEAQLRLPQRFAVKDVVRLRTGDRPFARVGAVRPDGKLEVWVLKMKGIQQHWKGPKVVDTKDVTNNYGPLDEVGIGSKLFELELLKHGEQRD